MTKSHIVTVPSSLTIPPTIEFANALLSLPTADEYVFDFSQVKFLPPFPLLYLSSEIQRCRAKHPELPFKAINIDHCTYEANMGFFRAFGMDYGKKPGEAKGSPNYLPIEIYNVAKIRQEAWKQLMPPPEFLEKKAAEITKVLTQTNRGVLYDVVVYCMREILRNVFEHSQATSFGLCAQYWPSRKRVSLAILDRGIGIKKSLSANPYLNLTTDESALEYSIQPGISGTAFEGADIDGNDTWANSGYGLYMTSNLCKESGNFFIASGGKGLYISKTIRQLIDIPFEGTALNLTLDLNNRANLSQMLEGYRKMINQNVKIKPSPSSEGLITV